MSKYMPRYAALLDLVVECQPEHVVEIGTWNGKRATEIMAASDCYYTGFDLFEDATPDTDKEEYNVKEHHDMVDVARRMEATGFNKFCLIRGNTRETLPMWIESPEFQPFDFAFIDGGHSKETISSDFKYVSEAISEGGIIVLDDHYEPEIEGMGCNHIDGELMAYDVINQDGLRCYLKKWQSGS